MLDKLTRQEDIERGELHLGYLYYDADFYVSKICKAFRKKYPNISLILHAYQPAELEEELLSGKIDAAILYGIEGITQRNIKYLPFLKIPFTLFYSKYHRFTSLQDICIADLDGEKVIYPHKLYTLNHVNEMMEQMLREGGASISQKVFIHNFDEVPWIMEETGAVFISPMVNTKVYGSSTKSRFLLPDIYNTDVSAVWLKEHQNPAIRFLITTIKSCYS